MNVKIENQKDQTAVIKAVVLEQDYSEAVEKSLRNYRKKANVPGFRPGMVPMGIINKMYKKGVIAEESYRIATKAVIDKLKEDNTKTLGELMPSEQQVELDFDTQTEFEFTFEVGLAPEVAIDLTKKDKITKYVITVSPEMIANYKENFLKRYGKLEDTDVATKDEALSVTLDQEDMQIEDAYVGLIGMNDDERAPFIGKKVGDKMEVNVNELYKTPSQRASILSVKEEELDSINPNFTLEITKIRQFVTPELNEDFFKMAYPEGDVTNVEQMDKWAEDKIAIDLSRETEFKFVMDVRDFLKEKANLTLPDAFLKNWLFQMNEGKFSMEDIEKEFGAFADMMKWDIIQKHFVEELKLEVTPEELKNEAKALAAIQFAYYGMPSVGDDMLENYSTQMLSNREEAKKIYDKLYERKIVDGVSDKFTISEKKVSVEDFNKMFETAQQ